MTAPGTAVVTGGGGDIGAAICGRLAAAGLTVVVADLDRDAAEVVASRIRAAGGVARTECVEVTDPEQLRRVAGDAATDGGLAAWVNNAGIEGAVQPTTSYPAETFARVMQVNVHSVFLGMQAALPHMLAAGAGAIVNLASTSAIRGRANLAGYVASKHAVLGLTRVAALESVGTAVRVNAVLPGPIETRMIQAINSGTRALAEARGGDTEVRRAASAPYGTVDDVAATVAHLVSVQARHVNGAAWVVDGGSTIA